MTPNVSRESEMGLNVQASGAWFKKFRIQDVQVSFRVLKAGGIGEGLSTRHRVRLVIFHEYKPGEVRDEWMDRWTDGWTVIGEVPYKGTTGLQRR